MEDNLKFGECYICLEETPLLSQCDCVELYLCENCIEKLRIYGFKNCTVCRAKYPKFYEEIIDIDIDFDIQPDTNTCKPCCLRGRSERHHCMFDFAFHTLIVSALTIATSCINNHTRQCYGWAAFDYLLPCIIAYFCICAILTSICR